MATKTFNIYKLHFTSPFHISDRRDDYGKSLRSVQSDTMYAAITATLAKMGRSIPDNGDLGFTISSLFPYYQESEEEKPVYFLPMPFQTYMPELEDVAMAKKVKKVQWVDSKLYSKLLKGTNLFGGSDNKYVKHIQAIYLTEKELSGNIDGSREFVNSEVFQRVSKADRTGMEDAWPFYIDRITFKDLSGLYFLVIGNTDFLDEALKLLVLEGIGTDRNVGLGTFEYKKDSITIEVPEEAEYQVALSLLIPESQNQLKDLLSSSKIAYDFDRRGGWITSCTDHHYRKNAIWGFLPGSVFCNTRMDCIGRIVNLQPKDEKGQNLTSFPVWRNGKSIMLPITII